MNRRKFLLTAGGGAAMQAAPRSANDRVQVGIVGVGGRGTYLARAFTGIGCRVAAVCDVWERRRRERAAQYQCPGFLDYREVVGRPDVDAVVVATPDHWHAAIAIAALEKGKDVYVEKPMCHTIEEARRMAETVRRTNRVLQVGSHGGSAPRFQRARKALADGMIGKLLMCQGSAHRNSLAGEWNWKIDPDAGPQGKGDNYIDWAMFLGSAPERSWEPERYFRFRKFWDYSGGIATDLFYHSVAPLNMMWGTPQFPRTVTASGGIYAFPDREVPDTFQMVAEYAQGHSVLMTGSMANSQGTPMIVRGREGSILFDHFADGYLAVRPDKAVIRDAYKAKFGENDILLPLEPSREWEHMENFAQCVRTRSKPNIDVETGARAQVAITMAVMAYRRKQVLQFDEETWRVSPAG